MFEEEKTAKWSHGERWIMKKTGVKSSWHPLFNSQMRPFGGAGTDGKGRGIAPFVGWKNKDRWNGQALQTIWWGGVGRDHTTISTAIFVGVHRVPWQKLSISLYLRYSPLFVIFPFQILCQARLYLFLRIFWPYVIIQYSLPFRFHHLVILLSWNYYQKDRVKKG